jgi:hypothetical protein
MKYFSLSTKAFYGEEHGNNKPNDCVEVTEQEYDAVKSYDAIAKELSCDANGKPILVDKVDDRTYQQKRISEYKPLAEQLDMQYWDRVNGTDTWKQHIDAVKTAHPKPTENA